jgi:hypothetical protein
MIRYWWTECDWGTHRIRRLFEMRADFRRHLHAVVCESIPIDQRNRTRCEVALNTAEVRMSAVESGLILQTLDARASTASPPTKPSP